MLYLIFATVRLLTSYGTFSFLRLSPLCSLRLSETSLSYKQELIYCAGFIKFCIICSTIFFNTLYTC